MSKTFFSPLRYPGGKDSLFDFLKNVIKVNELYEKDYAEAYGGGAGAALKLLMLDYVSNIHINDKDYLIYCFWYCVKSKNEEFIRLIEKSPVNMIEWKKHKKIANDLDIKKRYSKLELGLT